MFHAATVVFSDLNCPFCYALNEWLVEGGWGGDVVWRGVEHEPEIATPAMPAPSDVALLVDEVTRLGERAPSVDLSRPRVRPNSRRALVALAWLERHTDRAAQARTTLFRALWRDGLDLSDPGVLTRLLGPFGWDVGQLDDAEAGRAVDEATSAWRAEGWNRIPVIQAGTGTTYLGLGSRTLLSAFMGSALFDVDRGGACEVPS